jgi:predicted acyl esterase
MLLALAVLLTASEGYAGRGVKDFCCMVPMRDGTRLATDVYLPRFPRAAVPVILVRTPYGRHEVKKIAARYVCRRGYGLVVQDMRGRYGSQGDDRAAFRSDGWGVNRDGHDTIRWIARQCWCNGDVATWGVSAMGVAQNMLAPDAPAALKAQHVMMAFSDMYSQATYQGGVLRKSLVEGWTTRYRYNPANLATIRAHPHYDDFWSEFNSAAQAHRANAPAVFWGGWHDIFVQGAIDSFVGVHNRGGPRAKGKCRLILGPWTHDDLERLADPRKAACWPRAGEAFRFFEYWLKGRCNGVPGDRPVHYYVMGDRCDRSAPGNCWRTADNWPPPSRPTKFHLHADGRLRTAAPSDPEGRLRYRYDPQDPVPTLGGRNIILRQGPRDQRAVESRDDVLLFSTAPLPRPLEVTGRVRARLFVESDCPDTDFTVKLTDVYPDGRSMLIADGILRARYHRSFAREDLLKPGEVYAIDVDLWSTSIAFNRGHVIRIAVSSSNAPRFEPNPNTGEHPDQATTTRIATNTLHLNSDYPSHVLLPVVE